MPDNQLISRQAFRNWLASPLGQSLLKSETKQVSGLIDNLFGYHLILLGEPSFNEVIKTSPILHRVWLHPEEGSFFEGSTVRARQDKLPLLIDEADVVVVAHCLETHLNPHEVLRESYRILKPEGQLVIIGFNPWSIWCFWRLLARFIKRRPWDGQFISVSRLKDWLALLGFDVMMVKRCLFYPPVSNSKFLQKMRWMEWIGKYLKFGGGGYVILAQKRVITLTPIKPVWQKQQSAIPTGLIEPISRLESSLVIHT